MSFNIIPVASGYQEIHPYSAINIDSVEINTSLIMMKEWEIHPSRSERFPKGRNLHPSAIDIAHRQSVVPRIMDNQTSAQQLNSLFIVLTLPFR